MKIHCSYCDCAIDATLEICPHCGAKNDLAATYANKLEEQRRKDQSINWWIPLVVSENSKSIVLHFDYNMTVTIDNPWAK